MEPFFYLIYSSTVAAILVAAFISFGIVALLQVLLKRQLDFGLVIAFTFVLYFAIQFSPLPPALDRQLISILGELEYNKVDSNAAINNILFACEDKNLKGVRGYKYQDVIDAYHRDMDNFFKDGKISYEGGKEPSTEQWLKNGDLCAAAHHFNRLKFKRLVEEGKITETE
ncbi:hypothetical protein IRT38_00045 (plasmid) [Acinetobacter sp. SK-43]|uniref:hypothetical protein n=1 Tax=Acinetobacter sp. SK-43 TaxID=2785295 RepID=UPI00188B5557|nr:hypothetical protein [Acinetobacter sp. SK-43]MBF4453803.1 hypothetical protein [Acinetobacter sp. SK-43]